MRDGGKGDKKRKLVVSEEQFSNSWDAIFGKPMTGTPMTREEMHEYAKELTESVNKEIRNEHRTRNT